MAGELININFKGFVRNFNNYLMNYYSVNQTFKAIKRMLLFRN